MATHGRMQAAGLRLEMVYVCDLPDECPRKRFDGDIIGCCLLTTIPGLKIYVSSRQRASQGPSRGQSRVGQRVPYSATTSNTA